MEPLTVILWALGGKAAAELAIGLALFARLQRIADRLARLEGRILNGRT